MSSASCFFLNDEKYIKLFDYKTRVENKRNSIKKESTCQSRFFYVFLVVFLFQVHLRLASKFLFFLFWYQGFVLRLLNIFFSKIEKKLVKWERANSKA